MLTVCTIVIVSYSLQLFLDELSSFSNVAGIGMAAIYFARLLIKIIK